MLKSLRNHKAGSGSLRCAASAACRYYHNQPEVSMADCWCGPMQRKNSSLGWWLNRLQLSFYKHGRSDWRQIQFLGRNGLTEQKENQLAMIQLGPQIGWPAQRECNTAHARSRMLSTIVNTVAAEAPLWFRENIGLPRLINRLQKRLSIEMLLDDLRQILCTVKSPNWFDRSPAMVSLIFTSDGSH